MKLDDGKTWDVAEVQNVMLPRLLELSAVEALGLGVEINGEQFGLPSPYQWYKMVKECPDLAERVAHARKFRAEKMANDALAVVDAEMPLNDRGNVDTGAVRQAEAKANNRRWMAAKLDGDTYGDKQQIDMKMHGNINLQQVITDARNRVQGRVIEGEVEQVDELPDSVRDLLS